MHDSSSTLLGGPPVFTVPTPWLLSSTLYFDQFWASVACAVLSSPRHASLSRPAEMENRAAASQVAARSSLGGPSATATATCNPSNRDATAIVLSADIVFPRMREQTSRTAITSTELP